MKNLFLLLFGITAMSIFAQKDSLQLGDPYWEDQLYINVSYNILNNQPTEIAKTGFSYGFGAGYIKDIPLKRNGKIAIGVGLGYSFDSFNHGLKAVQSNSNSFDIANNISRNKLLAHNIEMPIQFRWRSSSVNLYSFWRFYAGIKVSYNFNHSFSYIDEIGTKIKFSNVTAYNKFQTGLIMSAGYGTFNFHVYYGVTPILNNANINGNAINSKIVRFGLSFYLL